MLYEFGAFEVYIFLNKTNPIIEITSKTSIIIKTVLKLNVGF